VPRACFWARLPQLLAASTDTPEVHLAWIKTPRKRGGLGFMQVLRGGGGGWGAQAAYPAGLPALWGHTMPLQFVAPTPTRCHTAPPRPGPYPTPQPRPPPACSQIPILADVTKAVAARYGVLKRDAGIALRGLYIINPEVRGRGALHVRMKAQMKHFMTGGGVLVAVEPIDCGPHWEQLSCSVGGPLTHAHCCGTPPQHTAPPAAHSQGVLEHITVNNFPIGRNVDEALRTLQVGVGATTKLLRCRSCPQSCYFPLQMRLTNSTGMGSRPGQVCVPRRSAVFPVPPPQAVQYVAEHGEVCPAGGPLQPAFQLPGVMC
jgi:alkyl hydroperoxide reductase subunit AhpC